MQQNHKSINIDSYEVLYTLVLNTSSGVASFLTDCVVALRLPIQHCVHTPRAEDEDGVEDCTEHAHPRHYKEGETKTNRAFAPQSLAVSRGNTTMLLLSLPVVESPCNEPREDEGPSWVRHGEEVVQHAEVLQPKELRRRGGDDGPVSSVSQAHQ